VVAVENNILRMGFEGISAQKGILFCAIARKGMVLARCASIIGNFSQITNSLLDKVAFDLKEQTKMTLTQADLLFHCVSSSCGLVALAITELDHDRAAAFTFLDSVLEKFLKYQVQSFGMDIVHYPLDNELSHIIGKEMERYSRRRTQSKKYESKHTNCDKIAAVQSDVEELKDTMVANIEVVIEHGEKVELLMGKADQLATNSITFKRAASSVQRAVWLKNMKVTIALGFLVLLFLYFFVSLSCGGLSWSVCIEE